MTTIMLLGSDFLDLLEPLLLMGQSVRFRVHGTSMLPCIRERDLVTVSPPGSMPIRLGNVVAFRPPGTERLILHRVVKICSENFLISGDNTLEPDGIIPRSCLLGVVIQVQRKGRAVCFGNGPEGRLFAFLVRHRLIRQANLWKGKIGHTWRRLTTRT